MTLQHLTMPAWYEAEILQGTRNPPSYRFRNAVMIGYIIAVFSGACMAGNKDLTRRHQRSLSPDLEML